MIYAIKNSNLCLRCVVRFCSPYYRRGFILW